MTNWHLALLAYLFFTTVGALLTRQYAKESKLNPLVSSLVRNTIVGLPFAYTYAYFTDSLYMPSIPILMLGLVEAFLGVAYGYTSFYAVKYSDASSYATLVKLHILPVILISSFWLNEGLTSVQMVGACLLLLSGLMLGKVHVDTKSLKLILLACVLLGGIVLFGRYLVEATSVGTTMAMSATYGYLIKLPMARRVYRQRTQVRKELKKMLRVSMFIAPQILFFLLATDLAGSISLVSALASTKVILVTIAAAIFLKERDKMYLKFGASTIALAGTLLM